jgi:hypothetical protein
MLGNINSLIKSCGNWTVPAAKTKSIGLPADALVPSFLPSSEQFHGDLKLIAVTRTEYRQDKLS